VDIAQLAAILSRVSDAGPPDAAGQEPLMPVPDRDEERDSEERGSKDAVLDTQAALSRLEGDRQRLVGLQVDFLESLPARTLTLDQALGREDLDATGRAAGALSAAADRVGAVRSALEARRLQSAARHGDHPEAARCYRRLLAELDLVGRRLTC
jgi:HPt (histidine-containing phosphotransfer) domain-containing protein